MINEDNEETLTGVCMHKIENEGKPLSDFGWIVYNCSISFMRRNIIFLCK